MSSPIFLGDRPRGPTWWWTGGNGGKGVKQAYLGGQGAGSSDLSSDNAELDDLDLGGVKLGSHGDGGGGEEW